MNKKAKDEKGKKKQGTENVQPGKGKSAVKFGLRLKVSLAIISLVSIVIISITGYFIWQESALMKDQTFQFMRREVVHLSNTAQGAIGVDELGVAT